MKELKHKVELTLDELRLLDGRCSPEAQEVVNTAFMGYRCEKKYGLTPAEALLVSEVTDVADKNLKVVALSRDLSYCRVCEKSKTYRTIKRGRNVGQKDYDNPIYLSGIDFEDSFVVIKGHASVGCCTKCFEKIKPALMSELARVQAEVSEKITGHKPKYKRYAKMVCECGWKGDESEMRPVQRMFDYTTYPGGCPKCERENAPLGHRHIKEPKDRGYVVKEVKYEPEEKVLAR